LLRKDRTHAEVYNDLDGDIVNLFKVAREQGEELALLCELTPFARDEFKQAYEHCDDPLERARRTLVRSFMGFGSSGVAKHNTGFRANSNRSHSTPAQDWRNYPDALRITIDRLRGVVIENRDALDCMRAHDGPDVLHYVDPPYVHETRSFRTRNPNYLHELSDAEHGELATGVHQLEGHVIVSGYRCPLYDQLYEGWTRVDRASLADGARKRLESLWLSPSLAGMELVA
jgi:DNA adenine methylase